MATSTAAKSPAVKGERVKSDNIGPILSRALEAGGGLLRMTSLTLEQAAIMPSVAANSPPAQARRVSTCNWPCKAGTIP